MSRTLQFKRYSNTALLSVTGATAELIVDSTNKTITVHDGSTAGGTRLATETFVGKSPFTQAAFNKANSANSLAQAAFNYANTIVSDTQIDNVARAGVAAANANITFLTGFSQSAYNKANTIMPSLNANTSAYASKYFVEFNPVSNVFSYTSYPDASSPYITGYSQEIHVSPVALNDNGRGTIGDPVKTIARAKQLLALAFETTSVNQRKTIVLHPGDYVENVTIDTQYTVLTTHELIGKSTTLSGTLTLTTGCTIDGLKMSNLVISGTSANGSVDIIGCTVTTSTTKTSSAYTNFRGCDLSSSTLSITGTGTVVMVGGNYFSVTVNNAAATILAKAVVSMGPVTLTAGTMQISDTLVYSATNSSNAITQSAGSFLTLNNSQTLIPDLSNVSRNSFGGFYSILHSVYDKPNSAFTGTSLSSISYSQYINADRLVLASGGQITFPDSTVQTTAANNTNIAIALAGTAVANANITLLFGLSTAQNTLSQTIFTAANNAAQTIPQNAQAVNYVLQSSDAGKHLYYTNSSAVNLYIPWTANTSWSNGTSITIISQTGSSANVTILPNTGVSLFLAGNTTSNSRIVTTYGMASLIMVKANTWFINGTGVV
jgi:hypothetical protein